MGFVHDGGLRGFGRIGDRHRDREALDRVHRDANAQRCQHLGGVAAQRQHIAVGRQHACIGAHAGDALAAALQALNVNAETEGHAQGFGPLGQRVGELEAVTGLVPGQAQRADKFVLHLCQRGLVLQVAGAVQQLVGHVVLFENLDVLGGAVELLLGAKQLQRALLAVVVLNADLGPQFFQAITAVLGQAHHAALVDAVARLGAVAQHGQAPAPHGGVEHGLDHQRAVVHQHPLDGFQRHTGAGPGRRVAWRDLARIGVAGFQARAGLAVDHFHLMASTRQVIGHRGADDTAAKNEYTHSPAPNAPGAARRRRINGLIAGR